MSTFGWMCVFAFVGAIVAGFKGRGSITWGMICGFIPFVGFLILLILPSIKDCPDCDESISPKAKVCPHCGKRLRQ